MGRRNRRKLPVEPRELEIEGLSHEGRGIARIDDKVAFVADALPGERVRARLRGRRKKFEEYQTLEVLRSSESRVIPPCAYFGVCGGCVLQHMAPAAQIEFKQSVLAEQFRDLAGMAPERWLEPLVGPELGYRHKARLGVRYVQAKDRVLVGFRERASSFLADIESCPVLQQRVSELIAPLGGLLHTLEARSSIAQIEVAVGDDAVVLVFRNLCELADADRSALRHFAVAHSLHVLLQPGGPESISPLWPEQPQILHYALPDFDMEMQFRPLQFTQVNPVINRLMIARALELLAAEPGHRVLDLFCGIGNFTLPLARTAGSVIGVEGDQALVEQARANAEFNGLDNCAFHVADLFAPAAGAEWLEACDRVLLDPPRSGAREIIPLIAELAVPRVVYVSCNPATLARDAAELGARGYHLQAAGVMDMFPHTAHVESIALFTR